jgi:hypothetical protein
MAPSVAQLAPETVDTKQNIKTQEVKTDNVCIDLTFIYFIFFISMISGTLLPILLPLL